MRGDDKVLDFLQAAIRAELTATNQYTLHGAILANSGLPQLAARWSEEAAEERGHRDRFIARMLFLEGVPDVGALNPVRVGKTVPEIMAADLAAEVEGRALYREAAQYALSIGDIVTFELFGSILQDEEGHIDFLETQLRLIASIGLDNYAANYAAEFG